MFSVFCVQDGKGWCLWVQPVESDLSPLNFRKMLRQSTSEHTDLRGPGTHSVCFRACVWWSVGENQWSTHQSDSILLSSLYHFLTVCLSSSLFLSLSNARTPWQNPVSVTDTDRERHFVSVSVCVYLCSCWQAHLLRVWLSHTDPLMHELHCRKYLFLKSWLMFSCTRPHLILFINL